MASRGKHRGMGIVEVIIGAAIIATGILALIDAYTTYVRFALANQKNVQAAYLAEEGLEVVTFFRDTSWVNIKGLSTSTPYYLQWNSTKWATSTSQQYIDGFLRSVQLLDVYRDGSNRIITNGSLGAYDPDARKVIVQIDYAEKEATTTKTMTTYITNVYK